VVGSRIDQGHHAFREWLAAGDNSAAPEARVLLLRKRRAEVERLESRNERDAGLLISRELVRSHVFAHLETLSLRLLRDVPTTLAARMPAARTTEERVRLVRDAISAELATTKDRTTRGLRACRAGDRPPDLPDHEDDASRQRATAEAAIRSRNTAEIAKAFDEATERIVQIVAADVTRGAPAADTTSTVRQILAAHLTKAARSATGDPAHVTE
jgi:hypothetical protein